MAMVMMISNFHFPTNYESNTNNFLYNPVLEGKSFGDSSNYTIGLANMEVEQHKRFNVMNGNASVGVSFFYINARIC